jgi:hypothetical protein
MRWILLFAALLCGCREKAAPPPERPPQAPAAPERVQEQEPNDFQRAQQIPARAIVSGTLQAPRDDDWYRVGAGPGKLLALRIELKGASNAWIETYDRDRNPLLRVHAGGDDPGLIPAMACLEACFVKVSGTGPQGYELSVLGGDPAAGEELEPNNRAVDATELQPGKPVRGTYLTADDEDWFRLALLPESTGAVRIEVTPVEGVRPELEVRALAGASLLATFRGSDGLFVRDLSLRLGEAPSPGAPDGGSEDAGTSDGGLTDAGAEDAGPAAPDAGAGGAAGYYLVLKGKSRRGAPRTPYTLTATVEAAAPDLEVEPNDDPEHATPLQGTATGYIAPAGDQDWYRVHAEAPMVLHAELSGADRADLELAVYTSAGADKPRLLARANEGGPREPEVLPAVGIPAGDSYVLVQAAARQLEGKWVRDGEDRQTPYRLAVQLSPDDGTTEREPNDDLASAQPITVPVALKGWIWPRKDVDVFRFHVAAGQGPVSIVLSAVRGVDLQLRLYQLHGERPAEVIDSSDARRGEGEEKLVAVPLKEGDYAVEVSSPRNKDASASQPYTLSVQ